MFRINSKLNIDQIERSFFKKGHPLKKLLKVALDLFGADQVGILYGTDSSKVRFLPTSDWDRGVADMFDGKGAKGKLLKYFGCSLVSLKKLSPVYFFKTDAAGQIKDNDGVISYMLRTCASYYKQGISIIFNPDISTDIFQIDNQYVSLPFYSYNGGFVTEPDIQVKIDLNIIKHFKAKNYISIYLPDYGILVINTADPDLMARADGKFIREDELKEAFDILIRLVEVSSLALLGQLKGRRGALLLWKKETQLRQTSQELIENERKYRDLYENAPIAYFSLDCQGTIIKVNQTTLSLSGYEKQELIGHNILEFHAHELGEKKTPEQVRVLLDKSRSVKDIEFKFRNKTGQEVWISLCVDTIRDTQDQMIEIRAMAVDISERKVLEKQLIQAQKMEAIGTLAGGIAHDFNNILAPISGYSEILLMDADDQDPQKKEHLKIIHDCALYAKGLVNQMLTFSKQKESEFKLQAPHVIVQEALALARSFVPATIKIQGHINQSCGLLMADSVQVHQVVMNLISNAYHAMEEKGGLLKIVLDQVEVLPEDMLFPLTPGSYIDLTIEDTGPGIPADVLDRIFDPFFTTKQEGKGSGIGLSVVHGIIQSHNGYITVKSKQGQGTRFDIYLPVYSGTLKDEEPIEPEQPIQKGNERILLVDDDKKVAFMVKFMLENLGYQVVCCIESPKALKTFETSPDHFDLVITDLTMPDMTGYQLAEKISLIRPDMPVILCTGFGESVNKKRINLHGIKGFLYKPVSVKDVSSLIRKVLDRPTV
ncbi:MAG: ATP-binding protein [Pseudomonadota bacterium]